MTEPQINSHQSNCLSKTDNLTDDHLTEDMTADTMQVRSDHHPAYIGDFPPEPSSKNDIHC